MELQKGSFNNKLTLTCGDSTVVRIGSNTKHLAELRFLKGSTTSNYGRPHRDRLTQHDYEAGYQLGAALYDKHGHPVKKGLSDQEQRELLDAYKAYYDITWHGFPSRVSQTLSMHRTLHLAEEMHRKYGKFTGTLSISTMINKRTCYLGVTSMSYTQDKMFLLERLLTMVKRCMKLEYYRYSPTKVLFSNNYKVSFNSRLVLGCDNVSYPWIRIQWFYSTERKDPQTQLAMFNFKEGNIDHQEIYPPTVVRGKVHMAHRCLWATEPDTGIGQDAAKHRGDIHYCAMTAAQIFHNPLNNLYLRNDFYIVRH